MGRVKFAPHVYQRRAIKHVEDHPRCLLFLDMGLGKTVVVLTAIQNLLDHAETGRVLVVAPRKVAETTWSMEAAKWRHLCLRVETALGDSGQRMKAVEGDADVVVMSRDSVTWLEEAWHRRKGFPFTMIVIDELTGFKSTDSHRFRAMFRLQRRVERVVGLTGTPIPNGLQDIFGQVAVVDGGERLGRFVTEFRERYFDVLLMKNHIPLKMRPKPGAEEEIRGRIADITLTMRAEDWLELPEMTEVDVEVEMSESQMRYYRRFKREKVLEHTGQTVTAENAAALANKLSQYVNGQVYDDTRGLIRTFDHKLRALAEIARDDEHPLLVFCHYRHDFARIMEYFSGAPHHIYPREYKGREELEAWNAGEIRMLLAHPASTAYGLNMQAGGHRIVWYSTGWNLELYQQANARLHRQGQREHVTVMRILMKGTIDEQMSAALRAKGDGQSGFLEEMKREIKRLRD